MCSQHKIQFSGDQGHFVGGKAARPPSSAEVKNEWRHTSFPPVYLHVVDRDIFSFNIVCLKSKHSLRL